MAYLEQTIEKLLVDALATAVGTLCPVTGYHQTVATGLVKSADTTGVLVKMSIRANESFGSRIITIPCLIYVKTRVTDDPECSLMPAILEPVLTLLSGYNLDPAAMAAALSSAGVFAAGGLMFNDGGEPDFDPMLQVWYTPILIQLKGVISPN